MDKKIIAYGYTAFRDDETLIEYLGRELFTKNKCRHRYTQAKKADVIIVSRKGFAFGHMIVKDIVDPNAQDIEVYPKVKKVYLIESTAIYKTPVRLMELGIHVSTFGKTVDQSQFEDIKKRAGLITRRYCTFEGAGFGSNEQNKKVEMAAIRHVVKWYRDNGWAVESVENQRCGYDLRCVKEDKEANVEVKGISGRTLAFIVTAGEVEQAQTNPNFILVAITDALSPLRKMTNFSGEEFLKQFTIEALQFRAALL